MQNTQTTEMTKHETFKYLQNKQMQCAKGSNNLVGLALCCNAGERCMSEYVKRFLKCKN